MKIKGIRWWMVSLVAAGLIINYLARNTLSVAAPTLMKDLNITTAQYSHVVVAWQLCYAFMQPVAGYVLDTVGTAWEGVCAGVPDPSREIAQARLAITRGMHESVRAVDRVFHAAGTNAIYRKYGLERYFRDVHTAVQHAAGLPVHIESAGKVFLGVRPQDLGW